jgi:sugar phosphate isomerase/epimerase
MPRYGTDEEPRRLLPNEDTARFRAALAENLARLSVLAHGRAMVCVENYGLDAAAIAILAPHWQSGDLALCWDIAKAVDAQGRMTADAAALLAAHRSAIRQVHLHDVREGRSHCVLGTGAIDIADHLRSLAGADVLDWCIEVRPREAAVASLAYLRQVTAKRLSLPTVEP